VDESSPHHSFGRPLRITRVWPIVLVVGLTAIAVIEGAPALAPLVLFGWIIVAIAYSVGQARDK
jgi:hypothetical protein